jgi:hypothetical protein
MVTEWEGLSDIGGINGTIESGGDDEDERSLRRSPHLSASSYGVVDMQQLARHGGQGIVRVRE